MSQAAVKMLPAHVGIGGGHDNAPDRFVQEYEADRERLASVLAAKLQDRLTPALVRALKSPRWVERFELEVEMMFQRIELLSSK